MPKKKYEPAPVHDWRPIGNPVRLPPHNRISAVLEPRIPLEKHRKYLIIASRASNPRNILGAKVMGACVLCDEQVWVAPSAQPLVSEACFVCEVCTLTAIWQAGIGF